MTAYILSLVLGGLTIGSALMVILSKHPVRSVLYLVVTFFFISGHFILMNAQFLAIVNLIVYAGAIMVLFLFVLMLLNLDKDSEPKTPTYLIFASTIAGGALLLVLLAAMKDGMSFQSMQNLTTNQVGMVQNLGHLLFSKYVVPFEVSSILFIASMVGAVLLAKREKQNINTL